MKLVHTLYICRDCVWITHILLGQEFSSTYRCSSLSLIIYSREITAYNSRFIHTTKLVNITNLYYLVIVIIVPIHFNAFFFCNWTLSSFNFPPVVVSFILCAGRMFLKDWYKFILSGIFYNSVRISNVYIRINYYIS